MCLTAGVSQTAEPLHGSWCIVSLLRRAAQEQWLWQERNRLVTKNAIQQQDQPF